MQKQMTLPLDLKERDRRRRVWRQLPEQDRIELTALYAKSIVRAARAAASPRGEEAERERVGR